MGRITRDLWSVNGRRNHILWLLKQDVTIHLMITQMLGNRLSVRGSNVHWTNVSLERVGNFRHIHFNRNFQLQHSPFMNLNKINLKNMKEDAVRGFQRVTLMARITHVRPWADAILNHETCLGTPYKNRDGSLLNGGYGFCDPKGPGEKFCCQGWEGDGTCVEYDYANCLHYKLGEHELLT